VRAVLDELWDTSLVALKRRAERTASQRAVTPRPKGRSA
jgi:hypothetical protein